MDPVEKKLNKEQLKAVRHGSGSLLVIAGAGTGKGVIITLVAPVDAEADASPPLGNGFRRPSEAAGAAACAAGNEHTTRLRSALNSR